MDEVDSMLFEGDGRVYYDKEQAQKVINHHLKKRQEKIERKNKKALRAGN